MHIGAVCIYTYYTFDLSASVIMFAFTVTSGKLGEN